MFSLLVLLVQLHHAVVFLRAARAGPGLNTDFHGPGFGIFDCSSGRCLAPPPSLAVMGVTRRCIGNETGAAAGHETVHEMVQRQRTCCEFPVSCNTHCTI